jgi:hypothetical protein
LYTSGSTVSYSSNFQEDYPSFAKNSNGTYKPENYSFQNKESFDGKCTMMYSQPSSPYFGQTTCSSNINATPAYKYNQNLTVGTVREEYDEYNNLTIAKIKCNCTQDNYGRLNCYNPSVVEILPAKDPSNMGTN